MVLLASSFDQSRFLKAGDLTSEKKFRVKAVTEEDIGVGKDKQHKLVVWFTNDTRGLVRNRVNNRTIRGAFGDVCDDWVNKIIVLFPTVAEFRGTMKPALRVRIPAPKQAMGNGQPMQVKPAAADDLDIPEALRRTPKPAPAATADIPPDIDVDPELNDEITI